MFQKGPLSNTIYMVDYGLAQQYQDEAGEHVSFRSERHMIGTARYMSVSAHLGKSQSRRDDLESLGYMLIYLVNGELPWQTLTSSNIKEKYRKIKNSKLKHSPESLCKVSKSGFIEKQDLLTLQIKFLFFPKTQNLPSQFQQFMVHCKNLGFSETPKYDYLKASANFYFEISYFFLLGFISQML